MTFSDKLKKLREDKKMTQKDLAKHLGVTPRIISYYETGKSIPNDPELLQKIVKLFNVTLDYLLLDTQSKSESKIYKLVEKLIYDTQNSLIKWVVFPKANSIPFRKKIEDYKETIEAIEGQNVDSKRLLDSTYPIMKDFILENFPQFDDYNYLERESYFAQISSNSADGYLLFKLFRDGEILIALFAYISGEFKFISDSNKVNILDDLYIFADNQDNVLNKFIDEYLNKLPLKRLVCGYDFHFGAHNSGSIEDLKKQSFELIVKNAVMYNETEKVSSTLIKKLMDQGMIEEVNTLLDRPYKVKGTIIHGKQRGRLIGFPTLNIDYGMKYLPKRGVYGTIVEINHQYYIGMANIGMNPTFNDINRLSLEVNVFDFDEDVYGKEVEVTFYLYKREETVFNGLEGLKTQLTEDRKYLSQVMKKYLTLYKNNVK